MTPNLPAKQDKTPWPELVLESWQDTYKTLQLWTQVIGKIRLKLSPAVNHWWHVPLYVTSSGLTTSPMPYGTRIVQVDFDFLSRLMWLRTDSGDSRAVALKSRTVADFYAETFFAFRALGIAVDIWTTPVETPDRIPFEKDLVHAAYDWSTL